MANTCENELVIRGSPEQVQALVKLVEGETPFDFERVLPLLPPAQSKDVREETRLAWGVKWNASEVRRRGYGATGRVRYHFNTPWGPPDGVLNELARRFPEIEVDLTYDVEMLTCGAAQWRGGQLVETEGEAEVESLT
jgi:hypothetical protein